ncbi:MAG: ABC transporter ATP-binding protein [Candidatus Obscuribacterales bacterium]|nr:ABC transporter ATP-binding protein [Candidatus Obscuribacterales bacterium]
MESQLLLRVRDLSRKLGGQSVLSAVNFAVKQGIIVGVIGPNGAGKTTLLECVTGLQPHQGVVEFHGTVVPAKLRHAHVFYQPDQVLPYPDHGVYSTLQFFRTMFSVGQARLDELIDRLKLEAVLTKASKELSRGYQKRLLIAIGLLSTSPLLLLDEPFEGLDIKQTKEVVSILQDEKEKGRTLILSIHQIVDAQRIADEFLLLCQGKDLGSGTLEQLQEQSGLASGSLEDVFVALT